MRYVEKHFDTPEAQKYAQELKRLQLDELSLGDSRVHQGKTGAQLYDSVRGMNTLTALKEQMYKEQGGVCCYCGMKLEYPFDPQYRVEHVLPKESHRELVGEYKNLLLSCRANREETIIREGAARKERKKYIHCDEAKGSKEINYSPLNKSCESAFKYGIDGSISSKDAVAEKDIDTLGLNGDYLKSRRKKAIDSLIVDDSLLPKDDLIAFRNGLQTCDADGKYAEFYFVLIDVINQLLPAV